MGDIKGPLTDFDFDVGGLVYLVVDEAAQISDAVGI